MAPSSTTSAEYKKAIAVPARYARQVLDDDAPVNILIDTPLPDVMVLSPTSNFDDFFSTAPPFSGPIPLLQISLPPTNVLSFLRRSLPSKWNQGARSIRGIWNDFLLPLWIVPVWMKLLPLIEGRDTWILGRHLWLSAVTDQKVPAHVSHVVSGIQQFFEVAGWNSQLNGAVNLTNLHLASLLTTDQLDGNIMDGIMVLFRAWALGDPTLRHTRIETLDFQFPFLTNSGVDWSDFDSDKPKQFTHQRRIRDNIRHGTFDTIILPLHVGHPPHLLDVEMFDNHYVAAKVDFTNNTIFYGDSLNRSLNARDRRGFDRFAGKLGVQLSSDTQSLCHETQDDGYSCLDVTCNTIERSLFPKTRPWSPTTKVYERAEWMLLLAAAPGSPYCLVRMNMFSSVSRCLLMPLLVRRLILACRKTSSLRATMVVVCAA